MKNVAGIVLHTTVMPWINVQLLDVAFGSTWAALSAGHQFAVTAVGIVCSPALVHTSSLLIHPDFSLPIDGIKVHEHPASAPSSSPVLRQAEGPPVEHAQHSHVEGRGHTCSQTQV